MRFFPLLLPILAACAHAAEPAARREQIEKDLVLKVELTSPPVISVGGQVDAKVELRNESGSLSYPVVRPGDGSSDGRREPHVYFTATVRTEDGRTKPAEDCLLGRCGNYDMRWQEDVMELAPKASLALEEYTPPHVKFLFQEAGIVSLVAHYDYRGDGKRGRTPPSLQGLPAFSLSSAPVEIRVERPLDLVVTAKDLSKLRGSFKLSEVLNIKLVNRSGKDLLWNLSDEKAELRFTLFLQKNKLVRVPSLMARGVMDTGKLELKAGGELVVAGKGVLMSGLDEQVELSDVALACNRLRLGVSMGSRSMILSNEIAVPPPKKKGK